MTQTSIERYQTAIDALFAAKENGTIYNVDYKQWKEYAGSAYERSVSEKVRSPFFSCGKYEARTEQERDNENAITYGLHQFPSKKLIKLIEGAFRSPMVIAVNELIETWKPVSDTIKALKPMVVMGRKPSTDPRKTPERTLENTGTCAVCGQNVKLDKGQHIVAHGYTIRWGFQSGNCHGVGFKAVELSPEGIVSWKNVLEAALEMAKENIDSLRETAATEKTREARENLGSAEATIRYAPRDIATLEKRIATWEPKALPGAKV